VKRGGSARIIPSVKCAIGITVESLKPITIAGMLNRRLVKGPATPMSKRAFRDEIVPPIRMTAPNVPKGGKGNGKKKGKVAFIPYLRDMR
jgi:hypothetical protein